MHADSSTSRRFQSRWLPQAPAHLRCPGNRGYPGILRRAPRTDSRRRRYQLLNPHCALAPRRCLRLAYAPPHRRMRERSSGRRHHRLGLALLLQDARRRQAGLVAPGRQLLAVNPVEGRYCLARHRRCRSRERLHALHPRHAPLRPLNLYPQRGRRHQRPQSDRNRRRPIRRTGECRARSRRDVSAQRFAPPRLRG